MHFFEGEEFLQAQTARWAKQTTLPANLCKEDKHFLSYVLKKKPCIGTEEERKAQQMYSVTSFPTTSTSPCTDHVHDKVGKDVKAVQLT